MLTPALTHLRTYVPTHARLFLLALAAASLACNTLLPPRPRIEWDPAPDNVVLEAHVGGGMLYQPNAVYGARLWGDGRLIWQTYASTSGERQVYVATLAPEAMKALLDDFVAAGFFGWQAQYSPGLVYDAPNTCLRVALTSVTHSVCETGSGAPVRFRELFSLLTAGAGQAGAPFVPERGHLTLLPASGGPSGNLPVPWPADVTGLTLAEAAATGGLWLEGDALAFVWQAVNANSLQPIFWDGEAYYTAQLLVPGVTVIAPPELLE
jgi:hypothetical protein